MATAQKLVRRALRLATVIASNETPDATTVQDTISVLNLLLAEWHGTGIGLPDYSVSNELTPLTMSDADIEAVAHQLAFRIMPEYGQEPSITFVKNMGDSWNRLALRYFQPGRSDLSELPVPTGCGGGWDPVTGN